MGLAEEDIEGRGLKFWLTRIVGASLGLVAVVAVGALIKDIISSPSGPSRQVARIALVPDLPPPPPPPPKEEKKIEPPKIEQKQVEQPKPQEAPPQASEQLKMEGAGSADGIAGVQSGTVTEEYRGQTIGGKESEAGGRGWAWYGGVLQREVQQHLQRSAKLRGSEYRVYLRLWIAGSGEVAKVELAESTGNAEVDEQLRLALADLPVLRDRPPAEMPQPVRLRVTSRI
jgi:protein TonB